MFGQDHRTKTVAAAVNQKQKQKDTNESFRICADPRKDAFQWDPKKDEKLDADEEKERDKDGKEKREKEDPRKKQQKLHTKIFEKLLYGNDLKEEDRFDDSQEPTMIFLPPDLKQRKKEIKKTIRKGLQQVLFFSYLAVTSAFAFTAFYNRQSDMMTEAISSPLLERTFVRHSLTETFSNIDNADALALWVDQVVVPLLTQDPSGPGVFLNFNLVVPAELRFTARRMLTTDNPDTRFALAYPKIWRGKSVEAGSAPGALDDRQNYGKNSTRPFVWKDGEGYLNAGGFVEKVPLTDHASVLAEVQRLLETDRLVDRYTTSLVIDFTLYNTQFAAWSYTSIVFEFDSGGGIQKHLKSFSHETSDIWDTVSNYLAWAALGLEVLYLVVLIVDKKWKTFTSFAGLEELVFTCLGLSLVGVYLYGSHFFGSNLDFEPDNFFSEGGGYIRYEALNSRMMRGIQWHEIGTSLVAITLCTVWLRLLRWLTIYVPDVQAHLWIAGRAGFRTGVLLVPCAVLFISFALFATLAFGSQNEHFATLEESLHTCYTFVLGDMGRLTSSGNNLSQEEVVPLIVFFVPFVMVFAIVVAQFLLSIVTSMYAELAFRKTLLEMKREMARKKPRGALGKSKSQSRHNIEALDSTVSPAKPVPFMQKYGTDTSAGAGGESPNGNGISPSNKDRDENDVSAFHLVQTPRPALQGEGGIQGGGSSQAASERQRQAEKAKGFKDSGEPLFPINKDTPFAAIRLILFAIFYLVALVLQLKTDDAFYFRSALYTAISEATFEASDGQTGKTIWDVTDRTDTIRWITEVIPDICFSTTAPDQYSTLFPNLPSGLLGTVYTPVVIQDWNVLVGENPVRFSLQVRDRIPKAPEEIVRWVANQQNVSALIDHSLEISEEEQEERLGYIGCYPRGGTDAYGGKAAFVCEMSSDSQIAEAFFARVFERPTWFLEADTQKLVIDFLVYNGNTNIFGYTKIAFEFSDDGSVEKSLSIHEVKLGVYQEGIETNDARTILEAVAAFLLFTMLCSLVSKILIQPFRRVKHFRKAQRRTAEDGEENAPPKGEAERDRDSQFALTPSPEVGKEKAESRESKLSILGGGGYIKEPEKRKSFLREYFTEVGQQFSESVFIPVEVLLVITSIVCAFLWVTYSVNPQADTFSLPSSTSLGIILKAFEGLANRLVIYRRVSALNVMLLFLRMVRLFMFHPRAVTIGEIVLNSFWDNFWFCVMFIVFLIAFSFMGHFAFGGHMEDFSTIERAIESTLYVILGRIRYDEMYEANAAFAGLYFFPLTFLYFFFFRQVLISITLSHTPAHTDLWREKDGINRRRERGFFARLQAWMGFNEKTDRSGNRTTTRDELQRSGEATTANRLSQSNLLSATGGQSSTTLGEERSVFAGRLVTQQSLGVSEFEYNAWSPRRKTLEERRTETAVMILDCLTGDAEAQKKLPSKLRDYHDKMVKDYHALSDMNSRIGHHTDYGIENAAGAGAGAGAGAKASSAMKEKEATRRSKTGTHRSKTGTKTVAFGAVSKRQLGDGSNFIRSDAPQGGALSTTGSKRKTTTSFFGGMIAKQGDAEEEEHEVSDDEDESLINQREILSRYVVKLEYEIKQLQQDRSREKAELEKFQKDVVGLMC